MKFKQCEGNLKDGLSKLHKSLQFISCGFASCGRALIVFLPLSWGAFAYSGELVNVGSFKVFNFDNIGCVSEIPLIVESPDVSLFTNDVARLNESIVQARHVLESSGCTIFEKLLITGEVQATSIFEMSINRQNGWKIDTVREFIPDLGMVTALANINTHLDSTNAGGAASTASNPFNQFNGIGGTGGNTPSPVAPGGVPPSATQMDFTQLAFPVFMQALYDGTSVDYAKKPLFPLAYLSGVSEALSDQSMLYLVHDQKAFLQAVDPGLSIEIGRKSITSTSAVTESTELGVDMFRRFFGTMVEQRKNGATITEELVALNQAMLGGANSSDYITVAEAKQKGLRDGRYLALGFDQEPDVFKLLYAGIVRFVRQEIR